MPADGNRLVHFERPLLGVKADTISFVSYVCGPQSGRLSALKCICAKPPLSGQTFTLATFLERDVAEIAWFATEQMTNELGWAGAHHPVLIGP